MAESSYITFSPNTVCQDPNGCRMSKEQEDQNEHENQQPHRSQQDGRNFPEPKEWNGESENPQPALNEESVSINQTGQQGESSDQDDNDAEQQTVLTHDSTSFRSDVEVNDYHEDTITEAPDASSTIPEREKRRSERSTFAAARQSLARRWKERTYKFGLYLGLGASVFTLAINITILAIACGVDGCPKNGIAVISKPFSKEKNRRLGTLSHVIVNILSTILLTSSNYAMQVLCAPTRNDIDKAHRKGKWLDVGKMSLHNLCYIPSTRRLLWATLAISSLPLITDRYNATVFDIEYTYEDRGVRYTTTISPEAPHRGRRISRAGWLDPSTQHSMDAGFDELSLVVSQIMYSIQSFPGLNWNGSLGTSCPTSNCDYQIWNPDMSKFTGSTWLDALGITTGLVSGDDCFLATYEVNDPRRPNVEIKPIDPFDPSADPSSTFRPCKNSNWIEDLPFKVEYGVLRRVGNPGGVSIVLTFLYVIVAANVVKIIAISLTVRACSSKRILTIGDGVSTFLSDHTEDYRGHCMLNKTELLRSRHGLHGVTWLEREQRRIQLMGGVPKLDLTTIASFFVFSLVTISLLLARPSYPEEYEETFKWGTKSSYYVKSTEKYSKQCPLLENSLLVNLPQVLLTLEYLSLNRLCTSICFTHEWNNFSEKRKSLRTTSRVGSQRSTHLLQMPLRWSIPLILVSGFLHWSLSQSIYLVIKEYKAAGDGNFEWYQVCHIGLSGAALICFAGSALLVIIFVLYLLFAKIPVRIPPAGHCSAVICAACHPPVDDTEAYLKEVKWGVVGNQTGEGPLHCSFSSLPVTPPRNGQLYA